MGNASSLLHGAISSTSVSAPGTASTPVTASFLLTKAATTAPSVHIQAEAVINMLAEAALLAQSLAATAEASTPTLAATVKKGD